eukprot:1467616-Amphidinium_carterae.1
MASPPSSDSSSGPELEGFMDLYQEGVHDLPEDEVLRTHVLRRFTGPALFKSHMMTPWNGYIIHTKRVATIGDLMAPLRRQLKCAKWRLYLTFTQSDVPMPEETPITTHFPNLVIHIKSRDRRADAGGSSPAPCMKRPAAGPQGTASICKRPAASTCTRHKQNPAYAEADEQMATEVPIDSEEQEADLTLPATNSSTDRQLYEAAVRAFTACCKHTIESQNPDGALRGVFLCRATSRQRTPLANVIHLSHPLNFTTKDLKGWLKRLWKIAESRISVHTESTSSLVDGEGKVSTVILADTHYIDDFKLLRVHVDWKQPPGAAKSTEGQSTPRSATPSLAPQASSGLRTPLTVMPSAAQAAASVPPTPQTASVAATVNLSSHLEDVVGRIQAIPGIITHLLQGGGKEQDRTSAIRQSIIRRLQDIAPGIFTADQITLLAKRQGFTISIAKADSDGQAVQALVAALRRLHMHHEAQAVRDMHPGVIPHDVGRMERCARPANAGPIGAAPTVPQVIQPPQGPPQPCQRPPPVAPHPLPPEQTTAQLHQHSKVASRELGHTMRATEATTDSAEQEEYRWRWKPKQAPAAVAPPDTGIGNPQIAVQGDTRPPLPRRRRTRQQKEMTALPPQNSEEQSTQLLSACPGADGRRPLPRRRHPKQAAQCDIVDETGAQTTKVAPVSAPILIPLSTAAVSGTPSPAVQPLTGSIQNDMKRPDTRPALQRRAKPKQEPAQAWIAQPMPVAPTGVTVAPPG